MRLECGRAVSKVTRMLSIRACKQCMRRRLGKLLMVLLRTPRIDMVDYCRCDYALCSERGDARIRPPLALWWIAWDVCRLHPRRARHTWTLLESI